MNQDEELKRRIEIVRQAHIDGNEAQVHHRTWVSDYLSGAVLGANDGIITTFAVVAGVAGAALSAKVVLIMGFANLLADGFSMAMGNYLGEKSNQEHEAAERRREVWEVEHLPAEERQEIKEIYEAKGFKGELLEQAVEVITSDKELWVNEMALAEHGILPAATQAKPWKGALATFIAFILAGLVPLLPYLIVPGYDNIFFLALVATALILFLIGSLRSLFSDRSWWILGLEMLLVGMSAAGVAYLVGVLLGNVV
jgi:VIT1/CCC1 family predicted Fe2+/Mn2+ transporter